MTFINNTFDTVDDEELAAALALKSDKNETYTKSQVNNNFQPTGDYATNTALTDGLATKQATGDYATNTSLTDGLATKQDTGDYALHSELTDGLATKQDTGDYALHSELTDGLANKQDTGDFATNTALTDGLATKQDTGDFATNTALTDGLATKQDTGDFATNTALTDGLATKQDTGDFATNTALTDGLATKLDNAPEDDSYELTSSVDTKIANQAGLGYTQEQVNTLLDEKQSKPDTDTDPDNRFISKAEADGEYLGSVTIGTVSSIPAYNTTTEPYGLNTASVTNSGNNAKNLWRAPGPTTRCARKASLNPGTWDSLAPAACNVREPSPRKPFSASAKRLNAVCCKFWRAGFPPRISFGTRTSPEPPGTASTSLMGKRAFSLLTTVAPTRCPTSCTRSE